MVLATLATEAMLLGTKVEATILITEAGTHAAISPRSETCVMRTAGPRESRMGVRMLDAVWPEVSFESLLGPRCLLPELLDEFDLPRRPSASRPLRR